MLFVLIFGIYVMKLDEKISKLDEKISMRKVEIKCLIPINGMIILEFLISVTLRVFF
jgi:hypothetical protein